MPQQKTLLSMLTKKSISKNSLSVTSRKFHLSLMTKTKRKVNDPDERCRRRAVGVTVCVNSGHKLGFSKQVETGFLEISFHMERALRGFKDRSNSRLTSCPQSISGERRKGESPFKPELLETKAGFCEEPQAERAKTLKGRRGTRERL